MNKKSKAESIRVLCIIERAFDCSP